MVRPGARGTRIQLYGKITDSQGLPVEGVCVEIRQSNPAPSRRFSGWGRTTTDGRGVFRFWTLQPECGKRTSWVQSDDAIEIVLLARALDEPVFTRAYFETDPDVDADPLPGTLPSRREPAALIARAEGEHGWRVDISLPVDRGDAAHGAGRPGASARRGGGGALERSA
jgi:protocatechuate 3,4-dioxygenase beta subunit